MTGLAMTVSMRTDSSIEWSTPAELFDPLEDEFRFTLDVAASADNARCSRFFTEDDNGLWQRWAPERCWMNPPYGGATPLWVRKAHQEASGGALVVGLLPARTDTAWFHEHVLKAGAEVRFVRGRVAFDLPGVRIRPRAPFPSLIVVWRPPTWIGARRWSLRTIGYDANGKPQKLDEGPSGVAGPAHISGSLVIGGPGAVDRHRAASIRTKSKRAALVAEPELA